MRGTVVDFSDDRKTFDDGSSYMFGDALMIHPITRPMYYNREGAISDVNTLELIYLPQHSGTYWFDLHSNRCYEGGQEIKFYFMKTIMKLMPMREEVIQRFK